MIPRWLTLLILVLGIFCSSAEDDVLSTDGVHNKSNPKGLSAFKEKLAKTELSAKPVPAALKTNPKDEREVDTIAASDLGITLPPSEANDTIKSDHHTYYNSTFYMKADDAMKFWVDLDALPTAHVVVHDKLSDSYRQASTIELTFDFPFYGHPLRNITIATGGFLYMGDYLHNWIAATQYVAPLMANFDTRLSPSSVIKYHDNSTAFTVQWENVFLQNRQDDGSFTFQVTLLKSGDIIFAYKTVPIAVSNISDAQHPVKVGLSDAYILERAVFFVRRKTVYEYNRIHFTNSNISNNTALYFTALPTCLSFKDCPTCLDVGKKLDCNWCEATNRCSDGIDRHRQIWLTSGCAEIKLTFCPAFTTPMLPAKGDKGELTSIVTTGKGTEISRIIPGESSTSHFVSEKYTIEQNTVQTNHVPDKSGEEAAQLIHEKESSSSQSRISPGAIATILVFFAAIAAVGVWMMYAYKFPQSSSGQFLIKYRPSQWALKKESSVPATNSRHL